MVTCRFWLVGGWSTQTPAARARCRGHARQQWRLFGAAVVARARRLVLLTGLVTPQAGVWQCGTRQALAVRLAASAVHRGGDCRRVGSATPLRTPCSGSRAAAASRRACGRDVRRRCVRARASLIASLVAVDGAVAAKLHVFDASGSSPSATRVLRRAAPRVCSASAVGASASRTIGGPQWRQVGNCQGAAAAPRRFACAVSRLSPKSAHRADARAVRQRPRNSARRRCARHL